MAYLPLRSIGALHWGASSQQHRCLDKPNLTILGRLMDKRSRNGTWGTVIRRTDEKRTVFDQFKLIRAQARARVGPPRPASVVAGKRDSIRERIAKKKW